jgi:hypothetical protein
VVSELEEELEKQQTLQPEIRRLEALRGELSALGHRLDDLRDVLTLAHRHLGGNGEHPLVADTQAALTQLEGEHRTLRRLTGELEEQVATRFNPTWGSVFKQGGSQSLFGSQVDDFSCIYTSRVANFAHYGTNHYFRVLKDPMAHDHQP